MRNIVAGLALLLACQASVSAQKFDEKIADRLYQTSQWIDLERDRQKIGRGENNRQPARRPFANRAAFFQQSRGHRKLSGKSALIFDVFSI